MADSRSLRPARQAAERARVFFQNGFRFADETDEVSISSDEEDIFNDDLESDTESDQAADTDSESSESDSESQQDRHATNGGGGGDCSPR